MALEETAALVGSAVIPRVVRYPLTEGQGDLTGARHHPEAIAEPQVPQLLRLSRHDGDIHVADLQRLPLREEHQPFKFGRVHTHHARPVLGTGPIELHRDPRIVVGHRPHESLDRGLRHSVDPLALGPEGLRGGDDISGEERPAGFRNGAARRDAIRGGLGPGRQHGAALEVGADALYAIGERRHRGGDTGGGLGSGKGRGKKQEHGALLGARFVTFFH